MYVWAYRIISVLLVVISVYVYIASDFNKTWWLPHSSLELQAAFWGIWIFCDDPALCAQRVARARPFEGLKRRPKSNIEAIFSRIPFKPLSETVY